MPLPTGDLVYHLMQLVTADLLLRSCGEPGTMKELAAHDGTLVRSDNKSALFRAGALLFTRQR